MRGGAGRGCISIGPNDHDNLTTSPRLCDCRVQAVLLVAPGCPRAAPVSRSNVEPPSRCGIQPPRRLLLLLLLLPHPQGGPWWHSPELSSGLPFAFHLAPHKDTGWPPAGQQANTHLRHRPSAAAAAAAAVAPLNGAAPWQGTGRPLAEAVEGREGAAAAAAEAVAAGAAAEGQHTWAHPHGRTPGLRFPCPAPHKDTGWLPAGQQPNTHPHARPSGAGGGAPAAAAAAGALDWAAPRQDVGRPLGGAVEGREAAGAGAGAVCQYTEACIHTRTSAAGPDAGWQDSRRPLGIAAEGREAAAAAGPGPRAAAASQHTGARPHARVATANPDAGRHPLAGHTLGVLPRGTGSGRLLPSMRATQGGTCGPGGMEGLQGPARGVGGAPGEGCDGSLGAAGGADGALELQGRGVGLQAGSRGAAGGAGTAGRGGQPGAAVLGAAVLGQPVGAQQGHGQGQELGQRLGQGQGQGPGQSRGRGQGPGEVQDQRLGHGDDGAAEVLRRKVTGHSANGC